jgi:Tol biopolymer transport system component
MVTNSGLVKVLDFGLAELAEAPISELASTETLKPETEEGTIVGTVAYMSPEQAQGKRVDARSDIFSFGSLLYEMVTGRSAFRAETKLSTLSAILEREPAPVSGITPHTPPDVEKLIARCMRKDPERRVQHMVDVKLALEELREDSDSGRLSDPSGPARRRERRGLIAAVVAGVIVTVAVAAVIWSLERSRPAPSHPALTRLTSDSGLSYMPALSPDGRLLAYASDRSGEGNLDIWVKQVAGGEPVRLTHHTAADLEPAFSPDGTRIAFRSERDGRGIYVVSALGGDERRVAEHGFQPQWSPDGQWISYGVNTPTSNLIYAVPANGGTPRQLRPEMASARPPVWSPDGQRILFMGSRDLKDWDWWTAPFEGGQAIRTSTFEVFRDHRLQYNIIGPFGVGSAAWPAAWSAAGNQILFSTGSGDSVNVWALSLSPRTWQVTGEPQQLTFGAGDELGPSMAANGVAGQRLLAYANVVSNTDVWSLAVDHNQGKATAPPQRLTRDAARDYSPFPSADGQKVAFISDRSGNNDVWIKDVAGGREWSITIGVPRKARPILAADGSKVAYVADEYVHPEIYVVLIGPGGEPGVPQRVCDGCGRPYDWSPDGSKLLYSKWQGERVSVALLDITSGGRTELLRSERTTLHNARFSPDGGWILFDEAVSPSDERLWIAPHRGPTLVQQREWILVSEGLGIQRQHCWAPDGNLVYTVSERDGFRCIWAQRLEAATKRPWGAPFAVEHFHSALSMTPIADWEEISLNAGPGQLFFSSVESTGNIWLARIGNR